MKKIIALITAFMMLSGIGIQANAYKYEVGLRCENVNERLANNLPDVFDINTALKNEILTEDFSGNKLNSTELVQSNLGNGQVSYEGNSIKVVKTDITNVAQVTFRFQNATQVKPGFLYAFSCDITTENVSGASPYNMLSAFGNNKYLREASGSDKKTGYENASWSNLQILMAPEGTERLYLTAYLPASLTGTVYFDNFKLDQIILNPLETILLKPNYKGLIYGDGEADISLDVAVSPQNYYNIENLTVEAKLIDENENVYRTAQMDAGTEIMNFTFSSKGLSEGDYYLVTNLIDKANDEIISTKENTIRKRDEDYRPIVYLDENGRIFKNGNKTFLKRMFNSGTSLEVMQTAHNAGIDTVANYGTWWIRKDSSLSDDAKAALQYLEDNDMTHHIALNPYIYSVRNSDLAQQYITEQEDIIHLFTQIANDYKDSPILDGYYLHEENDPFLTGDELRWSNEIFAAEDIDHPTLGVADKFFDKYGTYVGLSDIIGIDPYPVHGKDSDDLSVIGKNVRMIKKNFPNRPVYLVLQGFCYSKRGDERGPNETELKNMAWQAICEGAEGLDWYSYSSMIQDTNETKEQWIAKLNAVFADIEPYENIILSDEPTPKYNVIGGGDWLNMTMRHSDGKTYLFAVNNTKEEQSVNIKIDGIGTESLLFAPYEVKRISYNQSALLSSDSQIKSAEFSNGKQTFGVIEGEENRLFVNADSGVINYSVKTDEGATLYIDGVPMPSSGKITVRHTKSFKITVVAEDGISRTDKVYQVVK